MEFSFLKNPSVLKIFNLFESENAKIYMVGGAVRNELLGIKATDFDFATPLKPDDVVKILSKEKIPMDLKGIKFGCVTAIVDDIKMDITTFRKELYTKKTRFPKIEYSTKISDDYIRRDFTVNAIYVDATGKIIDLGEGLEDLKNGVLKFIIHPKKSIYFDPLRLFRYFRFCSLYFYKNFDKRSLEFCLSRFQKIRKDISRYKIKEEMNKILSGDGVNVILNIWRDSGLLYELDTYLDRNQLDLTRGIKNE